MSNKDHHDMSPDDITALSIRLSLVENRMEARFDAGVERMGRIEQLLADNNSATAEVRDIVVMGKSFFKVMGYMGAGIKWAISVGAAIAGAYYAWLNWLRS